MGVESEITKWYRGKAIFITGATGFMGKVLLEKLLRSCPDIGPIYILVREKKDVVAQDRVEDISRSLLFDKLRKSGVNPNDRIIAIPGDVGLPDLGISNEHRLLLQDTVSVVFHLAATVRFNEPLRIAVAINLGGTEALMQLCLGMTRLSAVVHVSTAYSNCGLSTIEERIYSLPVELKKTMHCVAGMDDELLKMVTNSLLSNHPNTYTFTKALAEHVVAGCSTKLPIVVVRPSIVAASWREPVPGWVDGIHGPTGIMIGAARGLLRSIYGIAQLKADIIPVDVCANLFIAAAWELGLKKGTNSDRDVRVYNCVSRPFKSLSWNEFFHPIDSCSKKYTMSDFLMSPKIRMTNSRVKHVLRTMVEQILPALLADFFIRFSGGSPRVRHQQSKVQNLATLVEHFITHEFQFEVDNIKKLKLRLNPTDQVIFNFDVTEINWKEYMTRYFLGVRKYMMNEEDHTIPACRQRAIRRTLIETVVPIGVLLIVALVVFYLF